MSLVLSVFPGIGLLDRAFEEQEFTVVRGPDLLWGGDIKRFHPPAGVFDGVIGGPPCQGFSRLVAIIRHNGYREQENLIPEFERVVSEAQPTWFVMENVEGAPIPRVDGYQVDPTMLNNRWLGEVQSRKHRFSFGTRDGRKLDYSADLCCLENPEWEARIMASDWRRMPVKMLTRERYKKERLNRRPRRTIPDQLELQGLPRDFYDGSPFTAKAQQEMLGNGVPLFMGRAIARAVKEAMS